MVNPTTSSPGTVVTTAVLAIAGGQVEHSPSTVSSGVASSMPENSATHISNGLAASSVIVTEVAPPLSTEYHSSLGAPGIVAALTAWMKSLPRLSTTEVTDAMPMMVAPTTIR